MLRAGHTRLVSAMDVEHTGSRVVTGGCAASCSHALSLSLSALFCSLSAFRYDFNVRIYDFAGMKRDLRPFRELEPVRHPSSW